MLHFLSTRSLFRGHDCEFFGGRGVGTRRKGHSFFPGNPCMDYIPIYIKLKHGHMNKQKWLGKYTMHGYHGWYMFAGVSDWHGSMEQGRTISPSWAMGDPGRSGKKKQNFAAQKLFLPGGPQKPVISGVMMELWGPVSS